jgi:hypothetical protein
MEFLSYVVLFGIALWIGWHLRGIVFLANLSENPDRVIKMLEEIKRLNREEDSTSDKPKSKGTELKIERVGDMLYAFTKDNDEFIAQGSDLKTLLDSAQKRFPNKVFFGNIPNGDSAKELV